MISIQSDGADLPLPDVAAVRAQIARQAATAIEFVRGVWVQYAQAVGPYRTGAYLRGIQDNARVTVSVRETEWEVSVEAEIVNTAPHARIVEDGHRAFRMPDQIDWSGPNVRQGPNGPYLRIPFRHRAFANEEQAEAQGLTAATRRAMMPQSIYARAQALAAAGTDRPGRLRVDAELGLQPGHMMATPHGHAEAWRGARAVAGRIDGQRVENPAWKSSKFEGMFRKATQGGGSQYLTIRTITPRSQGWAIPAQVGHGIARAVTAEMRNGEGGRRLVAILHAGAFSVLTQERP